MRIWIFESVALSWKCHDMVGLLYYERLRGRMADTWLNLIKIDIVIQVRNRIMKGNICKGSENCAKVFVMLNSLWFLGTPSCTIGPIGKV